MEDDNKKNPIFEAYYLCIPDRSNCLFLVSRYLLTPGLPFQLFERYLCQKLDRPKNIIYNIHLYSRLRYP